MHRFEIRRNDGSGESAELVSRSFLLHDFIHLAVETVAHLRLGFYGLLEMGTSLGELNAPGNRFLTRDLEIAEKLTGPMQSVHQGRLSEESYVEQLGPDFPDIVSMAFVQDVRAQLRRRLGEYASTPYGGSMTVEWEQPGP